jgi:hypothetical protein
MTVTQAGRKRSRAADSEAGSTPPTLSGENLSNVLGLLKGTDSVELKLSVPGADRNSTVAEVWCDPEDSRILEFSTRCAPSEAFTAVAETKTFLARHDDDLLAARQTKSWPALEYFAATYTEGANGAE